MGKRHINWYWKCLGTILSNSESGHSDFQAQDQTAFSPRSVATEKLKAAATRFSDIAVTDDFCQLNISYFCLP